MRTKRYLQNHAVYQRTEMILRNPLASHVRGARQNGHAPSRAFGLAQKAIYAGTIVISLDAGYQGDVEDCYKQGWLFWAQPKAAEATFVRGVALSREPPNLHTAGVGVLAKWHR